MLIFGSVWVMVYMFPGKIRHQNYASCRITYDTSITLHGGGTLYISVRKIRSLGSFYVIRDGLQGWSNQLW